MCAAKGEPQDPAAADSGRGMAAAVHISRNYILELGSREHCSWLDSTAESRDYVDATDLTREQRIKIL